jgi:hypothetical protein
LKNNANTNKDYSKQILQPLCNSRINLLPTKTTRLASLSGRGLLSAFCLLLSTFQSTNKRLPDVYYFIIDGCLLIVNSNREKKSEALLDI